MFNAENYKETVLLPRESDYTSYKFYNQTTKKNVSLMGYDLASTRSLKPGKTVEHNNETLMLLEATVDHDAFRKHQSEYRKEQNDLMEKFYKDLLDNEGLPDNEFTRFLLSKAWDDGHSSGLETVWNVMSDYTELYEKAKAHFMQSSK